MTDHLDTAGASLNSPSSSLGGAEPAHVVRRRAFGAFLRSRRERLTPASVGLTDGPRRRTQGLRREEVALLAGVGITWYTWLEQGRDVKASPEVLSALAGALRLDPSERHHLYVLNGSPPPEFRGAPQSDVCDRLQRMLDGFTRQPAHVIGRRWDILVWNRAAKAVFGDYAKLAGDARNIVHMVFANAAHRRLLVDWDELAQATLAMFRSDSAASAGDPDFERLIAHLKQVSPEFRAWWPRQEVQRPLSGQKRIAHPLAGPMRFDYTMFSVTGHADLKLVVYTALEDADTIAKLDCLLSADAPGEPARR